jgi:membrane protease YdiL (CAAX protease family)
MTALSHLPVFLWARVRPVAVFLVWAALTWVLTTMIDRFFWSPRWKEFPHLYARLAGSLVIFWGTRWMLRREGQSLAVLGIDLRGRYLPPFVSAWLIGAATIVIASGVLTLFPGAQWHLGNASSGHVLLALASYAAGSYLEELLFRGYLLRRLTEGWGRGWALAIVALGFGLFHLPGLSGVAAVKMVCSTAACSLLFSAVYLRSGTLWSAVAAHLSMNWVLHTILGVTGKTAVFRPVFGSSAAPSIDLGFWIFLIVVAGSAWLLMPKVDARLSPRRSVQRGRSVAKHETVLSPAETKRVEVSGH